MQIDPDYALAHRYLASIYTLAEWNRPDLAAHHLVRSLEIDPHQADAETLRDQLQRAEVEAADRSTAPLPDLELDDVDWQDLQPGAMP